MKTEPCRGCDISTSSEEAIEHALVATQDQDRALPAATDLAAVAAGRGRVIARALGEDQRCDLAAISFDGFEREQAVVDGAEAGARDDDDWPAEPASEGRHIRLRGDRHAPAASALDNREGGSASLGAIARGSDDEVEVDRALGLDRGNQRRRRQCVAIEAPKRAGLPVARRDGESLLVLAAIGAIRRALAAGLDRLEREDPVTAGHRSASERACDEGLAGIGLSPGDEKTGHPGVSRSAAVVARSSSSRSPGSIVSGGIQTTRSPSGRRITPWLRTRAHTSMPRCRGGRGARSMPAISPHCRIDRTPGRRAIRASAAVKPGIWVRAFASVDSRSSASDSSPTAQARGFAVYVWP